MNVLTWNIFGIPFASPKMLSRPLSCGDRIGRAVSDFEGLTIVCVQESWGWGAGVFWPLLKIAQLSEYLPGLWWLLSYPIYAIAALGVCFPVPPRWDPKIHIARRIAAASGRTLGLNLFVVGDKGESQDYCHAVLDSGLLILVGVKPQLTGFSRYRSKSRHDAFANKGYLWAFLETENVLIVNTHLQSAGCDEVRMGQLRELRTFLNVFASDHQGCTIIVAGDLNMNLDRIHMAEETLGLKRLNTLEYENCLDYVMCNKSMSGTTTVDNVVALGHLSDHPLVKFCSSESSHESI